MLLDEEILVLMLWRLEVLVLDTDEEKELEVVET